jgi:hypothetical protein
LIRIEAATDFTEATDCADFHRLNSVARPYISPV